MNRNQQVIRHQNHLSIRHTTMKIAIGSDHAGYELKAELKVMLESMGHTTKNYGTDTADSVDYPDFAHPLSEAVSNKEFDFGILICGSANGMAMAANKHQDIRCAICWLPELAALARQHNDANILAIPARFVSSDEAKEITKAFFEADFEGGRHQRRVDKISC